MLMLLLLRNCNSQCFQFPSFLHIVEAEEAAASKKTTGASEELPVGTNDATPDYAAGLSAPSASPPPPPTPMVAPPTPSAYAPPPTPGGPSATPIYSRNTSIPDGPPPTPNPRLPTAAEAGLGSAPSTPGGLGTPTSLYSNYLPPTLAHTPTPPTATTVIKRVCYFRRP